MMVAPMAVAMTTEMYAGADAANMDSHADIGVRGRRRDRDGKSACEREAQCQNHLSYVCHLPVPFP